MKNIIFIFLFLFSNISLFSQCPFGDCSHDGLTAETAYELWTLEHLEELRDSVNNALVPTDSHWHYDKHFRLMADITEPLTNSIGQFPFMGHFHGGGHIITVNITANATSSYDTYVAPNIFRGLDGTLDSLIMEGSLTGGRGGMVASVGGNNAVVSNCINNATIITFGTGAAGITYGNNGIITNCINNGDISGGDNVGGIAGGNSSMGKIENCINTGKITSIVSGSYYDRQLGSYMSGIGGITGNVVSTITALKNNINLGTVEGQRNVGGIVGHVGGYTTPYDPATITNCINHGFVKGSTAVSGIVGGGTGGISPAAIYNCINTGVVEGTTNVGCIVGERAPGVTITNCHYDKQMCGEK